MFTRTIAIAALAALAATAPAGATHATKKRTKAADRSGSISVRVAGITVPAIQAPADACVDLDDVALCSPQQANSAFEVSGGILRLDWVTRGTGRVSHDVRRCGEGLQGAAIDLRGSTSQLKVRATFTRDGEARPSQDSGWQVVEGRRAAYSTEVC